MKRKKTGYKSTNRNIGNEIQRAHGLCIRVLVGSRPVATAGVMWQVSERVTRGCSRDRSRPYKLMERLLSNGDAGVKF